MALRRSASNSQLFDAVVGRLILEFLPDPGSLPGLLRPGGLMEFQGARSGPWLQLTTNLPLRRKCEPRSFIRCSSALRGQHLRGDGFFPDASGKWVYPRRKWGLKSGSRRPAHQ